MPEIFDDMQYALPSAWQDTLNVAERVDICGGCPTLHASAAQANRLKSQKKN